MEYINQKFDEERALYNIENSHVTCCSFEGEADGESALKEARGIVVRDCRFLLRYPMWHTSNSVVENCYLGETCRAALWYDKKLIINNSELLGIKALRECEDVRIDRCNVNSLEFGWFCNEVYIYDTKIITEYPFLKSGNMQLQGVELKGKYSFQYTENVEINNCVLDTKDAFWHAENITVKNCTVKGEYLAWYSKNITFIGDTLTIKSALKADQLENINVLADEIVNSMEIKTFSPVDEAKIEPDAMFKISYGLYLLTAKENEKHNGCIINTTIQHTESPNRISISVNKKNLTHDIIKKTKTFNVNILTNDTPFKLFKDFGFASGRDENKFDGFTDMALSENGLYYLTKYINSFISANVAHTIFIAEVTEAKVLSNAPSVTYEYYLNNIKPKPNTLSTPEKGFVCKICGYVYEGDVLPDDFICALCKHGVDVFEPIG